MVQIHSPRPSTHFRSRLVGREVFRRRAARTALGISLHAQTNLQLIRGGRLRVFAFSPVEFSELSQSWECDNFSRLCVQTPEHL